MPRIPMDTNFEAEDDVRTLLNAEKIKKNKKRLAQAMKKAREQQADLKKIA